MITTLIAIDADASISLGVAVMANKYIRRPVVTGKGDIVGIITQKDLLKGTLEAFQALLSVASTM